MLDYQSKLRTGSAYAVERPLEKSATSYRFRLVQEIIRKYYLNELNVIYLPFCSL